MGMDLFDLSDPETAIAWIIILAILLFVSVLIYFWISPSVPVEGITNITP
jgi:hypothetical protein